MARINWCRVGPNLYDDTYGYEVIFFQLRRRYRAYLPYAKPTDYKDFLTEHEARKWIEEQHGQK